MKKNLFTSTSGISRKKEEIPPRVRYIQNAWLAFGVTTRNQEKEKPVDSRLR